MKNSKKQFTEEDLRKAIKLAQTYKKAHIPGNFSSSGLYQEEEIVEIIKNKKS